MPAQKVAKKALTCATEISSTIRPAVVPRMLAIPEAAIYISATNWFVEELVRNNKLRAIVVGKGRKIDIRDLDAWIDAEKERQAVSLPAPIGFARVSRKLKEAA